MLNVSGAFVQTKIGRPDPAFIAQDAAAKDLNHKGLALANKGDYAGAVGLHRQALEMKLRLWGTSDITTAVSYNALGESLMHLGQFNEAEDNIKKALDIATRLRSKFDQAFYRENLAMVYESKGDLAKAGDTRRSGEPTEYICSYYGVSLLNIHAMRYAHFCQQCQPAVLRKMSDISQCSRCSVSLRIKSHLRLFC